MKFQKFYGYRGNDIPSSIEVAMDGNLIIAGSLHEADGRGPCTNGWIIKVDPYGELIWEREIGGSGCDEVRDIVLTPDSGIIFSGITSSFINHPEKGQEDFHGDYFIGKLDNHGNIEWIRSYGGLDIDQAFSISKGLKDVYMIAGASNSSNFDVITDKPMANLWALKVDEFGTKISSYVYGGNKHDWSYGSVTCKNGDYVFAGYTSSEDIDGTQRRANGDAWLVRVDRYGILQWQKIYSGKFEDFFTSVTEDKQGRLILAGNFETEEKGKQFWFLKMTPDGKKITEKIFGGTQDEYGTSVKTTSDGGYIMTGYSRYHSLENEFIKGGEDFWVIRFDRNGNIMWKKTYGGRDDERALDVVERKPGQFFVIGEKVNDFEVGGTRNMKKDFWLIKIVEEGCGDIEIDIYLGLKEHQAYVNRAFKLKAIVDKGELFLWDFGDGTTSTAKNPTKTYDVAGIYRVKLTVFLNDNCSKTYHMPQNLMVW